MVGQGFYLPYGSDPDIAHALSSTYWELGALGSHFHPTTGTVLPSIVAAIGKQSASKAGRASSRSEEPQAWLAKPSFLSTGLFDPPAFKKEQWRNIKV